MPENLDPNGTGDPNAATPESVARWILQAQAKLRSTGTLAPNEIPTGYKVENGKLVQDTRLWSSIYKGLLGVAGMATLGVLLGPTLAAGSGAAAAGAGIGTTGGGAAGVGAGASTVASVAAPAAAAGVLPATQIGNGAGAPAGSPATPAGLPSSTSSLTAAPGTANGLPDWLKTAADLGDTLGADAAGRAQGRNADNLANIGFAQAQTDLYNSELKAPQQIASNAVRGDILSNAHDVNIAAPSTIPVPTISGGLRPSMFSDTTRQLGKDITANAAATPMPVATAPVLQPMETAGGVDDVLNTAGYLSKFAKPASDIWKMFNHA